MDLLLVGIILLGYVLIITAFIGCIIPGLPGPPFAFLSIIAIYLFDNSTFSSQFLWIIGIITMGVFFLDYLLPIMGAKMFKATKYGIWFSIIGMLIGIFFFPPFGMILGMLFGAIIGELVAGKAKAEAIKVGIISFIFSIFAILIKIALVGIMAYYFTKSVIYLYL